MTYKAQNSAKASMAGPNYSRMACAGTSIMGGPNTQYEMFIAKYGNHFRRCFNGGNSGQYAQYIANRLNMNVINQKPAYCMLAVAHNDMGSGAITDTPAPGTGSVANALYYLPRIMAALRAQNIQVILCTEPPQQDTNTTLKTNILAWNSWLKTTYFPSLNDPGVILSDTGSVIADPTTGLPVANTPSTTATGTSGASTIVVADATGIALGMAPYFPSAGFSATVGKPVVIGISGTTLTLNGTLTANKTANAVKFFLDYEDEAHPSTLGATKMADQIYADMVAAGWINDYGFRKPLVSFTPATGIDNIFSNALLESTVTSGVGAGFTTNFSGTSAVVTDSDFTGFAQQVTLLPGETAGHFLTSPSASVSALRGRKIAVGCHVKASGFLETGGSYCVRATFDNEPATLPASFTNDVSIPIYMDNIRFGGNNYFYQEVYVPPNATTLQFTITTNVAFPSGAAQNGVILFGEMFAYDIDEVILDRRLNKLNFKSNTVAVTITTLDGVIKLNATGGAISQALPTADQTYAGVELVFLKSDASANTVTVTGATCGSVVLSTQFTGVRFYCTGSVWDKIGSF